MKIFGLDPGTTESGWCIYDTERKEVLEYSKDDNYELADMLIDEITSDPNIVDAFVYEMVACYGMAVGKTVFETVLWLGRFLNIVESENIKNLQIYRLYRKDVKIALCGSMKAKDGNIRQAIIDRFPATGGGKTPQIGTKSNQGPLFGISGDMWAALGLCLAYEDMMKSDGIDNKHIF